MEKVRIHSGEVCGALARPRWKLLFADAVEKSDLRKRVLNMTSIRLGFSSIAEEACTYVTAWASLDRDSMRNVREKEIRFYLGCVKITMFYDDVIMGTLRVEPGLCQCVRFLFAGKEICFWSGPLKHSFTLSRPPLSKSVIKLPVKLEQGILFLITECCW